MSRVVIRLGVIPNKTTKEALRLSKSCEIQANKRNLKLISVGWVSFGTWLLILFDYFMISFSLPEYSLWYWNSHWCSRPDWKRKFYAVTCHFAISMNRSQLASPLVIAFDIDAIVCIFVLASKTDWIGDCVLMWCDALNCLIALAFGRVNDIWISNKPKCYNTYLFSNELNK